jgi:hypothetical protein
MFFRFWIIFNDSLLNFPQIFDYFSPHSGDLNFVLYIEVTDEVLNDNSF